VEDVRAPQSPLAGRVLRQRRILAKIRIESAVAAAALHRSLHHSLGLFRVVGVDPMGDRGSVHEGGIAAVNGAQWQTRRGRPLLSRILWRFANLPKRFP